MTADYVRHRRLSGQLAMDGMAVGLVVHSTYLQYNLLLLFRFVIILRGNDLIILFRTIKSGLQKQLRIVFYPLSNGRSSYLALIVQRVFKNLIQFLTVQPQL